jgi:hypothetical protein
MSKPLPMAQSHQAEALRLAVDTTAQTIAVEQENQEIRAQLQKNLELIESFDAVLPRSQALQQQLREKKAELESKQSELIGLQSAIISFLKNPPQSQQSESLAVVPIVLNKVQKDITALTDAAVAGKTIAVPILSLYKVSEGLNRLYETLVEQGIIPETPEEKQQRIQGFISAQREVLGRLKAIAQAAQAQEPKVVEVAPATAQESRGPIPRPPTPEAKPPVITLADEGVGPDAPPEDGPGSE